MFTITKLTFCYFRREALEAGISEKDAHLALLEMSGIKTAKQAHDCEGLRKDKARLMEKLRIEVKNYLFIHIIYYIIQKL